MSISCLHPILGLLCLVGCGAKVVFVGDTGESAPSSVGGAAADLNGWKPSCPAFFDGATCPSECPLPFENIGLNPGRVFCTEHCTEETPTGCTVGAVCRDDRCVLSPCDVTACPEGTGCAQYQDAIPANYCVAGNDSPGPCDPYVADSDTCSAPCTEALPLPDGTVLCTDACDLDHPCVFGFSCRDDMAVELPTYTFSPCVPLCFVDSDCPGGLRCDTAGRCALPL